MFTPIVAPPMPQAPALVDPRQAVRQRPGDDEASVQATAEQFATLLIEQVVGGLHQGAHLDKQTSFADDAFETMLDQHLAQQIAHSDSFGLTQQIAAELRGKKTATKVDLGV